MKHRPPTSDKHGRPLPPQHSQDLPAKRFWSSINQDHMNLFLSNNDKYEGFLKAINSPACARYTMPYLMNRFGISLHEMQTLYADGSRQLALLRMSSGVIDVAGDIVEDARSRQEVCPRCDGRKVVYELEGKRKVPRSCPLCHESGEVRVVGDKHARDILFESTKLIKQGGPLVSFNQNNLNVTAADSTIEELLKLSQQTIMKQLPSTSVIIEQEEPSATRE